MGRAFVPNNVAIIKNLKSVRKSSVAKKALNYVALDQAIINGHPVVVRGYSVCNHDLYHLEVSRLTRIRIGEHMVSGIHGINSPVFHDSSIVEEYESSLDEVRIAFHEWLTRTSLLNTAKALLWAGWLISRRINPVAVLLRHYQALRSPESES